MFYRRQVQSQYDPVVPFTLQDLRKQWRKRAYRFILSRKPIAHVFTEFYQTNRWGDSETVSGPGSTLDRTVTLRAGLPALLAKYECRSLLDIPCGDLNWMKTLELDVEYIGADIVSELINRNQQFAGPRRSFTTLDVIGDSLPAVDVILCRDCLGHFSTTDVRRAIRNIKASGSRYLLATTFPSSAENRSIVTGEWQPINLSLRPFDLPAPVELLSDAYDAPKHHGKQLGLWRVADLPDF